MRGDRLVKDQRADEGRDRTTRQRVAVGQVEGAGRDGGRTGEGIGCTQGERAETSLGEGAADTVTRTARTGDIADRAGEQDVITVGIEGERAGRHRNATGDRPCATGDIRRGTGRPADRAAVGDKAARAGTKIGADRTGEHREAAGRGELQAAGERIRAGEGHVVADDADIAGDAAPDTGRIRQRAAATAEAIGACDVRRERTGVGQVGRAGAECHARQEHRSRVAEVEIGRGGRRGEGNRAEAVAVDKALDAGEGRERIDGQRAAVGDIHLAADVHVGERAREERTAGTDGDVTVTEAEVRETREDVRTVEGQRTQAEFGEGAGRIVERRERRGNRDARAVTTAT